MRAILPLISVLFCSNANAQTSDSSQYFFPKRHIKFSLADAIDPFGPAFMLGYEQFLGKHFSMMAEGGPIGSFDGTWVMDKNIEGYKLRGEMRFYTDLSDPINQFYFGLQGMFKHSIKTGITGSFCRSNCSYYQLLDYSFEKYAAAGHISIGYATTFGKHLVYEFGGFGGFRYKHGEIIGVPDDARFLSEDDENGISFDIEGPDAILSIGFSMRIGFGW